MCYHPLPSVPQDLLPFLTAKPLIWRQKWACYRFLGHYVFFFIITVCAVVLLTVSACVFVSLNAEAARSLVLFCLLLEEEGGAVSEDLSC